MYQCKCGHTFTREKEVEHNGESYCVCPLCFNDDYWIVKDATYMMLKSETLIGVWLDFLHNWANTFTDKQRVFRHMERLNKMRLHYLQQIKDK